MDSDHRKLIFCNRMWLHRKCIWSVGVAVVIQYKSYECFIVGNVYIVNFAYVCSAWLNVKCVALVGTVVNILVYGN